MIVRGGRLRGSIMIPFRRMNFVSGGNAIQCNNVSLPWAWFGLKKLKGLQEAHLNNIGASSVCPVYISVYPGVKTRQVFRPLNLLQFSRISSQRSWSEEYLGSPSQRYLDHTNLYSMGLSVSL